MLNRIIVALWPLIFFIPGVLLLDIEKEPCDEGGGIIEQSQNITIRVGKDTSITCRSATAVTSCVWLWEYPLRDLAPTVVAGFHGHGPDSKDCSIKLVNVSEIQTGWWKCSANVANCTIYHSKPIFLQVTTGPVITFEAKPVNRTFSIGGVAELECKTAIPVHSCQWSFQQKGQSEPLVVTEGPPVDEKDCSFKLDHVSYEQVGAWKCGARTDESDGFTYTELAYIQVEHKEEAFPVEFAEQPVDTEVVVGQTGKLQCKVREEAHIEGCRWYWQPIGRSQAWKVLMREFTPINNDCSIEFANTTSDPEGLWTCHVKPIHSETYKPSKSARLSVQGDVPTSLLTRKASGVEGEPVKLDCVAEYSVKTCQWKWKLLSTHLLDEENGWVVKHTFPANGIDKRDCSLTFKYAQIEDEGLWLCGARTEDDDPFKFTVPAYLSVKPPKNVRFAEQQRMQLAAENHTYMLNCSTYSPVQECDWMYHEDESKIAEELTRFNFTTPEYDKMNCSLVIPKVDRSYQGFWRCVVRFGVQSRPRIGYSKPFSLTVVKPGPVTFRSVSKWVHIPSGGSSLLECVTHKPVERCIWLYQDNITSPMEEVTHFQPLNFNNCSLPTSKDMKPGLWTCGARGPEHSQFTMAAVSNLEYVNLGKVRTNYGYTALDQTMLTCQLNPAVPTASCDWVHPSEYNVFEFNDTGNYIVESSPDRGLCTVIFKSLRVDDGQWRCIFSVNNKSLILGEGSILVCDTPSNKQMRWMFTFTAAGFVVMLIVALVFGLSHIKSCRKSNKASVQLNKSQPDNHKRYTEDPTKGINFTFNESPELLVDFSIPAQDNHHYEHVGRYLSQRPSFYQNVN